MAQAKRSRRNKTSNQPTTVPANLLIKAFRQVGGEPHEISFFDGPGSGEIRWAGAADADGRWRHFDRLLIVTSPTSPPLVFDVIPNEDAVIELDVEKKESTLTVRCEIRCVVARRGHITFHLEIEKKNKKLTYSRVGLQGPFAVPSGNTPPAPPTKSELDLYPSPQPGVNPFPNIVARDARNPYPIDLESDGFRSRMAEELGITFTSPAPANNSIRLFFEQVCPPGGQCAFGIVFTALRPDSRDEDERLITIFDESRLGPVRINVTTSEVTPGWLITQRPSRALTSTGKQGPALWNVTLGGIPAGAAYDLWNSYVEKYWESLDTVRGGNPVSLLPSLESPQNSPPWEISFVIRDRTNREDPPYEIGDTGGDLVSILGRRLEPLNAYTAQFSLGQVTAQNGAALQLRGALGKDPVTDDKIPTPPRLQLVVNDVLAAPNGNDATSRTIRLGALDITIGTQPPPSNNVNPSYGIEFNDTLSVEIKTHIYVERVVPGGQDDLPGQEFVAEGEGLTLEDNESVDPCAQRGAAHPDLGTNAFESCVDSGFRPKRPIVIAFADAGTTSSDRLFLDGREVAKSQRSQTVELNLRNQTPGNAGQSTDQAKVIVLDSNPFLVAQVQFTPFSRQVTTGSNIANWKNGGIDGAGWQLQQTGEGPADLVLPSQGIGEEMERGYPGNLGPNANGPGFTIQEGALVDFRLSPPARLSINVGEHQQRFIEAPWNLRRVLGFPGQRTPGARVRQLQFELLYGLSCDVRTPFLRLAEITSLLGAIPGRLPQRPGWMPMTTENLAVNGVRYQESRFDWSVLHRRYLSRLAILEPWDSHVRDSLILSEDVQCLIRKVRHEVSNSRTLHRADMANPIDPASPGLKGGATWGFESKNVYNAVMRPEGQNPLSTSASVSDLYFSSLGGYGRLVAGFDEDRSKIYDDVSLGRTYSYKLERIGRIACWWNRAKHVIVYERTVLPSKQFDSKQPRHAGRPIVRKVREYIKILDEKRTYPDSETEVSQTEQAALEKRRGFVAACSFPPGAEIPVDSSWGTDVGDIGWKVPLWNPAAAATNPTVYPKPLISPHLFADVGGVSQPVPVVISEPQNVYFYTDTRADTSGDPNEWPPIKGVDYVDCPLPRPQIDFEKGNPQQTTPGDALVPAGFGPCTFKIDPPPVPADLVAARAGKPLSAALESVTMVRAQLNELIPNLQPNDIREKFQQTLLLGSQLRNPLRDILQQLPSEGRVAVADLTTHLNNSFNPGGAFTQFFAGIEARCNDVSNQIRTIGGLIRQREAQLFAGLESQLVKLFDERRRAFVTDVEEVLKDAALDLTARKTALLIVVDQNIASIQNGLLLLRLSPGLLQKAVARAAGSASRLISESEQRIQSVLDRVNQYAVTLTASQLQELKNLTQELIRQVDRLFSLLDASVSQSIEPWLPDPVIFIVETYLVNGGRPLRELIRGWRNALETNILQAQQLTRDAALQALAVQNSWIAAVRDKVQRLGGEATDHVSAWRDSLVADIPNKPAWHIENQLGVLRNSIQAETNINFPELANLISNMLGNEIAGVATVNLRNTLIPLRTSLQNQITNATDPALGLLMYIEGAANHLCDQVRNSGALQAKLLTALESSDEARAIANAIRATVDQFHSQVNQYADAAMNLFQRSEEWPKLKDVYAAGNTALGVVRAFGKPPVVPNMTFERPALAYFYKELNDRVDLTPVLSTVAKASAVANALKPLGISLPTEGLVEKLVPPDLKNFDLSKIFPDFAGLNLKHLFPNLKMPAAANDNVKVSHGADPQTRRAWIDVDINFPMDRPATLFSIGPVSIRIVNARFEAKARVEGGLAGEPPKRTVRGAIIGDWELTVGGQTIVIFRRTEVRFDESGKLRFSLDPRNLEMPGILSFLQDFMKRFSDSNSGLTIGFAPGGVQAVLNLPIPDVQVGAFGLSNLRVGALLRVTVVGDDGFAIAVGFNVGRKLAPFALTIFILGGGGYLEVETKYVPAKRQITCLVQLGITACASLAIALGPIKGGVFVYFGITAEFRSGQGGGLTIGVMFLIRGEVSILGIVEACVSLLLEAKYSSGRLIGHGNLSIKIKICWCFTLEVSEDVTYELAGGGGSAALHHPELNGLLAFNNSAGPAEAAANSGYYLPPPPSQHYIELATKYIDLLT